jgi:hypothetical protein
MDGVGLVAILLAALAGYAYAIFRRTSRDHKAAKAATRTLGSKKWSDLAALAPVVVLLVLLLRVLVEEM